MERKVNREIVFERSKLRSVFHEWSKSKKLGANNLQREPFEQDIQNIIGNMQGEIDRLENIIKSARILSDYLREEALKLK